jgi:hypothetical protein
MALPPLLVTKEEIEREREELRRLRVEYDLKWRDLYRVVLRIRYWQRRVATLESRFRELRLLGWPRLTGPERREYLELRDIRIPDAKARLAEWETRRTPIEEEIRRQRPIIRAAEEHLRRKVVEEFIGDEACSGYDIYYDPHAKIYRIRDPETHELIREDKKLAVALTASIETKVGHDVPITLEITAVTYVTKMGLTDLVTLDKAMEKTTMQWLRDQGWGALLHAFEKIGIEYNGETHVEAIKLYPFTVPDYPTLHFYVERKSRYIPKRIYEGEKTIGA